METAFAFFSEVVRSGSIRQAAERLHVSASSISRQIQKLEHAFGIELLIRHPMGVKLTPAGEIVGRFVQSRSRELQRLKSSIDALKGLQNGHVSVYVVEGAIDVLLPRALTTFASRYPGITYDVVAAGTDNVMQAVAEDRCDIGISFHPVPRHDVEDVASISQPLYAVMAPSHPLAGEPELDLALLGNEPIGLPDPSFGIRHLYDHVVKTCQLKLNVRLQTNSIDMLRQFAVHEMGIVFLPIFGCERELATGRLIVIPIADSNLATASMKICKRAETDLTLAAQRFADTLVELAELSSGVASYATRCAEVSSS